MVCIGDCGVIGGGGVVGEDLVGSDGTAGGGSVVDRVCETL